MAWADCAEAITKAFGRDLTPDERKYLEDKVGLALKHISGAERRGVDPDEALRQILDDSENDQKVGELIAKRNAANGVLKRTELQTEHQQTWADDKAEWLTALGKGSPLTRFGSKNSLATSIASMRAAKQSAFTHELESTGLIKQFRSGKFDKEMFNAARDQAEGKDLSKYSQTSRNLVGLVQKHLEVSRRDQNNAGAWIGSLPGYIGRQTHDMYKIAKAAGNFAFGDDANFKAWRDKEYPRIDWTKTAPDLTLQDREKWLKNQWTEFATGKHIGYTDFEAPPSSGLGFANVGKRVSAERSIFYKTADDEYGHFKDFGSGASLYDNIYQQLGNAGRNTAIMRRLGVNASSNMKRVNDDIERSLTDAGEKTKLNKFRQARSDFDKRVWPTLSGQGEFTGNHALAQFSQMLLNIERMADLGMVVPNSLSDINSAAGQQRFYGTRTAAEHFGATAKIAGQQIKHMATGFGEDEKKLAAEGHVVLEGMHTPIMSGWGGEDAPAGLAARGTAAFMKYNGGERWWNSLRVGSLLGSGTRYAQYAGQSFDKLLPGMRDALAKFGISSKEWDVIRSAEPTMIKDGRKFLMPQNIQDADLSKFHALHAKGADANDAQLGRIRDNLVQKFGNLFHDTAESAAVTPSAVARSAFVNPASRGTVGGEALRHLLLYRSFVLAFYKQHMENELYGYHPDRVGLAAAIKRTFTKPGAGQLTGLTSLIGGGMGWAAISQALSSIGRGQTPAVPQSAAEVPPYMMNLLSRSGGLGLYGDLVSGQVNDHTSGADYLWSSIGGPTGRRLAQGVDVGLALRNGDTKKAAEDALKLFYGTIPGQNLAYTRWATDYMLKTQLMEMVNPGYMDRIDQAARDRQQPYFLDHRPAYGQD